MNPASSLGILLALTSAIVWGSGDFSGGVASRRTSHFHVVALSALSGIVVLLVLMIVRGEGWPSVAGLLWAALSGVSGALGLVALYRGLSLGSAATVAPVAAVISTALPVLVGAVLEGVPTATRLVGFAVALAGLWLVSQSAGAGASRRGLALGLLAGLGFGGFFVFIAQEEPGALFAPLMVARVVMLAAALVLLAVNRMRLPSLTQSPVALLAGILDASGNIFYLLARQFTRLDIAAALSSLYPAATVLLAWIILKEKITPTQWVGAGLCVAAVALIAF